MKSTIAISVVVPAYNEEKLIARCLESLKAQRFSQPFEIIVVNNNSRDKTEEIARALGTIVVRETIQGVVAARQRGLHVAKGLVVAGADCDCIYPPNWLANLFSYFNDPQVVAVGGPVEAEKNPYWGYLMYKFGFWINYQIYRLTGYVIYFGAFNFAFRRQTFLDIGGYHTYLDFGGDEWEPLFRLRKVGKVIFDPNLRIHLSLRRYRVGFVKFIVVHLLYYYSLNYILATVYPQSPLVLPPRRGDCGR